MNEEALKHTPVLLNEVINAINPQSGKLYLMQHLDGEDTQKNY
jgi:16S rRNA C1402 N4-methylase RsmH